MAGGSVGWCCEGVGGLRLLGNGRSGEREERNKQGERSYGWQSREVSGLKGAGSRTRIDG